MDFHILIVIVCVVLASFGSLLFINKFFRRKTFEEIIAEKKAMNEKIYQSKASSSAGGGGGTTAGGASGGGAAQRKPKKLQQLLKKEQKKEKKQRQRDAREQRDNNTEQDEEDSDGGQSEEQQSVESAEEHQRSSGLSKTHVEFEPDPEVLTFAADSATVVTAAIVEKEHQHSAAAAASHSSKQKQKKDKKNAKAAASGILVNKNEPVAVKENANSLNAEEPALNRFDLNPPKDVLEMKKAGNNREDNNKAAQAQQQPGSNSNTNNHNGKKEKAGKKEKQQAGASSVEKSPPVVATPAPPQPAAAAVVEQPASAAVVVAPEVKELKQLDEKVRQGSPKNQQSSGGGGGGKNTKQQNKKQQNSNKDTAATRELVQALDRLSGTDSIGVNLLMNLFRRAELNRSEIQILIDYLLNRQQDVPSTHAEWSDDIVQKLKRQLEEKERALTDAQEASVGIQAKLRELRTEINTERAQMNANTKAYIEKLHSKELELSGLTQEVQTLNEKLLLERQQFQGKLSLAQHAAPSQELLAKVQLIQNELAHKDTCIAELTHLVNAAQQKDEIIQQQAQQIHTLEQQRDELEQVSNSRIFELEQSKTFETELGESKVEIRNLQNALESTKGDLTQARHDAEEAKTELGRVSSAALGEKQKDIEQLRARNDELSQQLAGASGRAVEQSKEQTGLQATLDTLKAQLAEREQQLAENNAKQAELQRQIDTLQESGDAQHKDVLKLVDTLNADLAAQQQVTETARDAEVLLRQREKELLEQLQEQREKNNDLRMKNWKLVEALQKAETKSPTVTQATKPPTNVPASANLVQQQQQLQKTTAAAALSAGAPPPPLSSTSAAESIASKDEKQIRELFQRLYPEAVKACAGSALSLSFDQWVEQVLARHIKQTLAASGAAKTTTTTTANSSNKSTQSNSSSSSSSNNHNSNHNSHNDENHSSHSDPAAAAAAAAATNNNNNNNSNSRVSSVGGDGAVDSWCLLGDNSNSSSISDPAEVQQLHTQNAQLKARNDELTKLVTKTGNTLSELESRAREQEEHWRSVVRSKEEQILSLQKHSNGSEQDI